MVHIVDSDSSQTLAIEEVRRGRDLVIQGPPGTGKSQTIANVIASAIADGKTVLFVAEKMAALEVVKRRLDVAGVGDACLELHSNKANKRAVLDELRRTWELGAPRTENVNALNARLTEARDALNDHAKRLHAPLGAAAFTPFHVVGHLVRLRNAGVRPAYLRLDGVDAWTREEFAARSRLVIELADRLLDIGDPAEHPWRDVGIERALPPDVDRLKVRLSDIVARLEVIRAERTAISGIVEAEPPDTLDSFTPLERLAERLATAPALEPAALAASAWAAPSVVRALLGAGTSFAHLRARLGAVFHEDAWTADVAGIAAAFEPLEPETPEAVFAHSETIAAHLPALMAKAARLAQAVGRHSSPTRLADVEALAEVGARVATAPDADPSAFAQDLWDSGVERASDLAAAVRAAEDARAAIESAFSDAAWSADLTTARQTLSAHGVSFLRIFNREWRTADRLVRSFLTNPKATLERKLTWLDALGRGQAALKLIREETAFGQSAFGTDWRGERSASAPLLGLVEWMRSLRGLGAEPRLIASRRPDKARIGDLAHQLVEDIAALRRPVAEMYDDLGRVRTVAFGTIETVGDAQLDTLQIATSKLAEAHRAYSALTVVAETPFSIRLERLAELVRGQQAAAELRRGDDLGRSVFGDQWKGSNSAWAILSAAADWIEANQDVRLLASRIEDRADLALRTSASGAAGESWSKDVEALLTHLKAGPKAALSAPHLGTTPLALLAVRLAGWRDGGEALTSWVGYRTRAREAAKFGLADLVERLDDGRLRPEAAHDDFEQAVFEAIFNRQIESERRNWRRSMAKFMAGAYASLSISITNAFALPSCRSPASTTNACHP